MNRNLFRGLILIVIILAAFAFSSCNNERRNKYKVCYTIYYSEKSKKQTAIFVAKSPLEVRQIICEESWSVCDSSVIESIRLIERN